MAEVSQTLEPMRQDVMSYWYWQWVSNYYNYYLTYMWYSNIPGSQWGTQQSPDTGKTQTQTPANEKRKELEKQWLEYFQQQSQQWYQTSQQTHQTPPNRQEISQQPETTSLSHQTAEEVVRQVRQSGLNVEYTFQRGYEVKPAPLGRRIMASIIDIIVVSLIQYVLFTCVLKMPIQMPLMVRLMTDVNASIDEEAFLEEFENLTFYMAVYFVTVLLYESFFNAGGSVPLGGGTIGKKIMGLSIMRCETAHAMVNGNIAVFPGGPIGPVRSVIRAIFKNLSQTLILPMVLTVFVNKARRSAYDIMSGAMVVMQPPNATMVIRHQRQP
jgi:uncharacterized RDD family membrane protein YckC